MSMLWLGTLVWHIGSVCCPVEVRCSRRAEPSIGTQANTSADDSLCLAVGSLLQIVRILLELVKGDSD